MIAKGLDFPNVLLVGVINADTSLHFPDFRASEKTFQLVTQVAGRTGRGDKAETSGRSQVLLLVTDGEDVASAQGEAAKKAAQKAAEAGIRIYAIGLGTMTGDPIPLYDNSGQHAGYQQDSTGKPIYSKLNLKLLEELARLSDPANPNETRVFLDDGKTAALEGMLGALEKQQRTTLEASIKHQYGERFQLLLIPALLLLLIEMRLSERRRATA